VSDELIRQLADEMEIRNLVSRLAHLADIAPDSELDEYVSLFTDDAHWEMPGSAIDGRSQILAGAKARRASGIQGPGTHTRHVITTHRVSVAGESATGRAYFMMVGDTDTAPRIRAAGQYDDRYERTSEGWKLARRDITPG
jgi:3-phenylpropionate/cinnamic acid dioxygenase small subunit